MPDASEYGLTKKMGDDGKLRLIGKDDSGSDYEALTCSGPEFTHSDEEFLKVSDREHSSPKQFTEYFTKRNEKNRADRESALDDEYVSTGENVIRTLTATQQWQWLRGCGTGDAIFGENGAVIPRRRRFIFGSDGKLVEQNANV